MGADNSTTEAVSLLAAVSLALVPLVIVLVVYAVGNERKHWQHMTEDDRS